MTLLLLHSLSLAALARSRAARGRGALSFSPGRAVARWLRALSWVVIFAGMAAARSAHAAEPGAAPSAAVQAPPGSAPAGAVELAGSAEAPMCDPSGASVAARPELDLPLLDQGRLEELPCDAVMWLQLGLRALEAGAEVADADSERPQPAPAEFERQRSDCGCELAQSPRLERRPPELLPRPVARALAPSAAHRAQVYRPPLARG